MNDRTRAMEVLKQAREVLLSRLAERVLDNREDILDDAGGYSYCGAIESMHDQLGQRLSNVTAMLAHLQSADESPSAYESASSDVLGTVPEVDAVFGIGLEGPSEPTSPAKKDSSPSIRLDADSAIRLQTATPDWDCQEIDWSASAPPAAEQIEDLEMPQETDAAAPPPNQQAVADAYVEPDPAEAGCRDQVFQETDFRGVDLLTADFDTGLLGSADKMLSSAESGPGDVSAGE